MKKHILLITHRFFPSHKGGTEVLTLELAKGLQQKGFRVSILTGEPHYSIFHGLTPFYQFDEFDGLDVCRIHYFGFQINSIESHYDRPDRVRVLMECIKSISPDLVHVNHFLGLSAAIFPEIKALGLPVVFVPTDYFVICRTYQLYRTSKKRVCNGPENGYPCRTCQQSEGFWGNVNPSSQIFWMLSAHSLSRRLPRMIAAVNLTDRILPSTRFLGNMLIEHGIDVKKIHAIPYGVDVGPLPEYVKAPERFESKHKLTVGFIGTLIEVKGLHVILDALELLKKEDRVKIELHVYGVRINSHKKYYQHVMHRMGLLSDCVKFKGTFPHENIGKILRSLHLLIVPSVWYESIPLVLQSSLNAGTPVIVSEMGGLTEVFANGYPGFSFPAGDAKGLVRVLRNILADPGLLKRHRMVMVGKQRTMENYVDDMIHEYAALGVIAGWEAHNE